MALDILYRVVGIFHHIMKQRSTNRRRAKSDLLRGYLGHGYRMKYVWLARTPSYTLMSLFCKLIGAIYYLHLFTVVRAQIAVDYLLKGIVNHFIFHLGVDIASAVHNSQS